LQPLERLGESTDLRLLNDVVDLICEKKDLTAVIYDICNYQESDSACVYGKISGIDLLYVLIERGFSTVLMKAEISG
jgi:hypothetical protein